MSLRLHFIYYYLGPLRILFVQMSINIIIYQDPTQLFISNKWCDIIIHSIKCDTHYFIIIMFEYIKNKDSVRKIFTTDKNTLGFIWKKVNARRENCLDKISR